MPQANGSSVSAKGQKTVEKPKVDVPEDLEHSKHTYASSPVSADPWNSLGSQGTRNHNDIFSQVDKLGLSKKTQGRI
ncbi:hypothetical protein TWF481_006115 [Arthrobotrys musiformis]|uniref:Uncharacterized protein n=1 Tax=Arthrobotrys musiformis TaxID=47236 RepID=A0AAV9WHQ4_9PEZI